MPPETPAKNQPPATRPPAPRKLRYASLPKLLSALLNFLQTRPCSPLQYPIPPFLLTPRSSQRPTSPLFPVIPRPSFRVVPLPRPLPPVIPRPLSSCHPEALYYCHSEAPRGIWGGAFPSPCRRSAVAGGSRRVSRTEWALAHSPPTPFPVSFQGPFPPAIPRPFLTVIPRLREESKASNLAYPHNPPPLTFAIFPLTSQH